MRREHEQEKYIYIYNNREEFNNYGSNFHASQQGILDKILKLKIESICDVGTANGEFPRWIKTNGCSEVYGVDFAFEPSGDGITWIKAFAHDIPLKDSSVEYVTAFDFLEHLPIDDVDCVFEEFNRISTKGFIFSISYSPSCHKVFGEGLHLTVKPEEWWIKRLQEYGVIEKHNGCIFVYKT